MLFVSVVLENVGQPLSTSTCMGMDDAVNIMVETFVGIGVV